MGSATELVVQIREPLAPPTDTLSVLPPDRRDFSRVPIRVVLLSPGARSTPQERAPSKFDATLEHILIEGAPSADEFVFTVFPVEWIVAGTTIVGERVVVAPNGTRVVAQTRCQITQADVAFWKQKGPVTASATIDFRIRIPASPPVSLSGH